MGETDVELRRRPFRNSPGPLFPTSELFGECARVLIDVGEFAITWPVWFLLRDLYGFEYG